MTTKTITTLRPAHGRQHHVLHLGRRAAVDPKVHTETRRARRDALHAAKRIRRVGVTRAVTDKHVARDLRRASHHASRAAHFAVRPARTKTVTLLGAGVFAAVAYGGWKSYSP